jgi:tetratricopeptide (TPR) repeat protein
MILPLIFSLFLTLSPYQESIDKARASFDSGNYAEAIKTLNAELARSPQEASIHYWLTRCYYELRNYDKAIEHGELAVKYAPKNAEYADWLGRAYGGKAEEGHSFFLARKVKKAFEDAVRLNPFNVDARRDLMQYLTEAPWIVGGDKKEARKQVDAIAAIDPLQGRLAYAAYCEASKDWNEADAEYLAILDAKPNKIGPYMDAANYFADRKDARNLERALDAAAHLNSSDPRQNYYRAIVLILRGTDLPKAEQLLKAYIALPERSDFPSRKHANEWLAKTRR